MECSEKHHLIPHTSTCVYAAHAECEPLCTCDCKDRNAWCGCLCCDWCSICGGAPHGPCPETRQLGLDGLLVYAEHFGKAFQHVVNGKDL